MIKGNTLSAVLQVLSITVLIDDTVHYMEPDEFAAQTANLQVFVNDNSPEDPRNVAYWCKENWDSVRENLLGINRQDYIEGSLQSITDYHLIPMLYASMCSICRCDNELHEQEKSLLARAAKIWQLDRK